MLVIIIFIIVIITIFIVDHFQVSEVMQSFMKASTKSKQTNGTKANIMRIRSFGRVGGA